MPISEIQAITGRSVLMYPPRAALAWLVLLTFATGSDVSVVINMRYNSFWVYLTGIRGLMNILFVPCHIVWLSTKFCIICLNCCVCLYFLLYKPLILCTYTLIMAIIVH